jgi:hypothetical protein
MQLLPAAVKSEDRPLTRDIEAAAIHQTTTQVLTKTSAAASSVAPAV